jgi:outer membrane biogenesis lipoprotein LolB
MKTLILAILLALTLGCAARQPAPNFAAMTPQQFQTWQGNQLRRMQHQQWQAAFFARHRDRIAKQRAFMHDFNTH